MNRDLQMVNPAQIVLLTWRFVKIIVVSAVSSGYSRETTETTCPFHPFDIYMT